MTRLAEIKSRAEAATPGPWRRIAVYGGWDGVGCDQGPEVARLILNHPENASFIAASRSDVPWLLEVVEKLVTYIQDQCDDAMLPYPDDIKALLNHEVERT